MRNKAIDILRGLGILSIIFVHVTTWYTGNPVAKLIWNWGQFAVPVFVFCSTYLFFIKREKYEAEGFKNYSLSRLKRLLVPYYYFLIPFFGIYLVKNPGSITAESVLRQITLSTAGNELNWAVLLFVFMTLLMFPLVGLWRKARPLFYVYSLLAVSVAFAFMFVSWPSNFKLIMWLPWSLVILFSWFFAKYENVKGFFPLVIMSTGSLFISLLFLNDTLGASLVFINNKYPPNLYYLVYGIFSIAVLYYLAKRGVFDTVHKPVHYLSVNSYSIFFIHLWLIIAATELFNIRQTNWWLFFLIILSLTILIQSILSKIKTYGTR